MLVAFWMGSVYCVHCTSLDQKERRLQNGSEGSNAKAHDRHEEDDHEGIGEQEGRTERSAGAHRDAEGCVVRDGRQEGTVRSPHRVQLRQGQELEDGSAQGRRRQLGFELRAEQGGARTRRWQHDQGHGRSRPDHVSIQGWIDNGEASDEGVRSGGSSVSAASQARTFVRTSWQEGGSEGREGSSRRGGRGGLGGVKESTVEGSLRWPLHCGLVVDYVRRCA